MFDTDNAMTFIKYFKLCCLFQVPTASSRFYHIKGRTTYDRHYNDNAENVVQQVREVGHKLEQEALQKYMEKAEGQGQYPSNATVWEQQEPAHSDFMHEETIFSHCYLVIICNIYSSVFPF